MALNLLKQVKAKRSNLEGTLEYEWGSSKALQQTDLRQLSRAQLRNHLDARDLDTEGPKRALIERLESSLEEEKLQSIACVGAPLLARGDGGSERRDDAPADRDAGRPTARARARDQLTRRPSAIARERATALFCRRPRAERDNTHTHTHRVRAPRRHTTAPPPRARLARCLVNSSYTEQLEAEFQINKDLEERGAVYAVGANYCGASSSVVCRLPSGIVVVIRRRRRRRAATPSYPSHETSRDVVARRPEPRVVAGATTDGAERIAAPRRRDDEALKRNHHHHRREWDSPPRAQRTPPTRRCYRPAGSGRPRAAARDDGRAEDARDGRHVRRRERGHVVRRDGRPRGDLIRPTRDA